jgi:hypothetical protein
MGCQRTEYVVAGVSDGKMPITMGKTGLSTVLNQNGGQRFAGFLQIEFSQQFSADGMSASTVNRAVCGLHGITSLCLQYTCERENCQCAGFSV